MPYKCSVKGCKSNYDSTKEKVSMFQFPSNAVLRQKWLDIVELNSNLTSSSRICVKHFDISQIDTTCPRRISLKPSAEPSQTQSDVLEETVEYIETETIAPESLDDEAEEKINSFEEFSKRLEILADAISWNISIQNHGVCFYRLSSAVDSFSDFKVTFRILVDRELLVRIFKDDMEASSEELNWLLKESKLSTYTQLENLLANYQFEPDVVEKQDVLAHLQKAYQMLDAILNHQLQSEIDAVKNKIAELYEEASLIQDSDQQQDSQIFDQNLKESGVLLLPSDSPLNYIEEVIDEDVIEESEAQKIEVDVTTEDQTKESGTNFSCEACNEDFPTTHQLIKHMKKHKTNGKIRCSFCEELFDEAIFRKHVKSVHSDKKPHKCDLCPKSFMTVSLKNDHLKTHSKNQDLQQYLQIIDGSPRYICPKCSTHYENSHFLRKHIATNCRRPPKKRSYRYPCFLCKKTFMSKSIAVKHLRKEHNVEIENVDKYCVICNEEFEDYINHSRLHSCKFSCEFCGSKFLTREKVTNHEETKHANESITDRPFKCLEVGCGLAFKNVNHLKSHHQSIHSLAEREFQCNLCERRFAFRSLLTQHVRSHEKNARFKCNVKDCQRKFKKLNNLKEHGIRDHQIDAIYLCGFEKCRLRFKKLTELKQHRDSDHGDSFNIQKYFDISRK